MQPTAPELEILKLLWKQQPQTARELHTSISQKFNWSYSSTRKTLERMGDKQYLLIESQGNKKLYSSQLDKVATLAGFVQDFAKRIFEIDGPLPVAMFTDSRLVDQSEIENLEQLLQDLAQEQQEQAE